MNTDHKLISKLEEAFILQQAGQLEAAKIQFERILTEYPNQADALHSLGMICAQKRDFTQAIPLFKQAIASSPDIPAFHNNIANAYKALGQIDPALRHYHEALRLKPTYPEVLNNLGALLYKLGYYEQAITYFQKSIRINPVSVDSHYNLANSYVQIDRFLDATVHYQEALQLRPDHLGCLTNLGLAWCSLKHFSEARPLLEQVIEREPNNSNVLFHLGVIYAAAGELDKARICYERVLALAPDHANAHHNLATVYLNLDLLQAALAHYQLALTYQPLNKTAAHMIDAILGKTSSEGAPIEYTQALFDQYAYSYDQQVKSSLKYQVPFLLRQAITPLVLPAQTPWQALDLGCGTGLCAPLFTDIVGKLYGVDVSPNMIEIARQQGGYFKLYTQDIISYLAQCEDSFDLIIAADVFVYFGQLNQVFAYCKKILKNGGFFCFSIETPTQSSTTSEQNHQYTLTPTGRYIHQINYIQQLCEVHGFKIQVENNETLRYQDNEPVAGCIFCLQTTF